MGWCESATTTTAITNGLGAKSLLTGQRNNRNQCPAIHPEALPCPWDPKECLLQGRTPSKIKQITDHVIHCFLIIKKVHSLTYTCEAICLNQDIEVMGCC